MNISLDYDDMLKTGSVAQTEPRIKMGDRKYAVIIKNAHTEVGKFDITDKESIEESIYALNNNPNIPDDIRKSAAYFVKTAAVFHGIACNLDATPAPHEILVSDIIVKSAEFDDVPMISFADRKFILSDVETIKRAEEYFLTKRDLYPAIHRINVSRIIVKAAALTSHTPSEVTRAYSEASYGNKVEELLAKKASASHDEKYAEVLSALSKCYNNIPVEEFLDMVESCDKAAELKPDAYGVRTHELLVSKPKEIASCLIKAASSERSLSSLAEDE